MMFVWHYALGLLLALPVLAGAYVVLFRRRHKAALRYPGLGIVREAMGPTAALKIHLAPLLLFAGFTALMLAVARPVTLIAAGPGEGVVVLLMDVSLSMAASDVRPTRLDAARAAARAFVHAQPHDVNIGVVAFGGYAELVQPPTTKREDVLAALDRLELQRFTAIGSGLIAALLTIVPSARIPWGYDIFGFEPPSGTRSKAFEPQSDGYIPAAIVLVSDGRGTMGVKPADAAKLIAEHGIRVYTVGVGTLYGGGVTVEGWPPIHAEFEEGTLKKIASITRGEYHLARDAEKLATIYERLGRRMALTKSGGEITALFVAVGMVLSLAAVAVSLRWSYRPA